MSTNMKISSCGNLGQMSIFTTNSRERRKLEGQLKNLHSTTKYRVDKIDREMMALKRQLEENQRILGTHCDISRQKGEATITVSRIASNLEPPAGRALRQARRHSIASPMEMAPRTSKEKTKLSINNFMNRKPRSAFPGTSESTRPGSKESPVQRPGKSAGLRQRRHSIASPEYMTTRDNAPTTFRQENNDIRATNGSFPSRNRLGTLQQERKLSSQHDKLSSIFKDTKTEVPSKKLFLRRNSLPSFDSLNGKNDKGIVLNNNKREVLTAKLPTRIVSAGPERTRRQLLEKPVIQRRTKQPTPVSERTEFTDEESTADVNDKEENTSQEEAEESDSEENELPTELLTLPKISLEEKIDKYFSESIENESSNGGGHFEEVMEQFQTNKTEQQVNNQENK